MIALDELKKLPIEERKQIVQELQITIEEEESDYQEPPELLAELERRLEAYHADPSTAIPWETVKAKLLSRGA
ncbi:addiction module protein [Luteolibacter yonseiensis]|uniref:Addiction module protein n=1 Tax=Luteolibacter yonseiensis TaxID=1144680 RepID=A0A934VA18_9BACT|nr:addiction module protein [Luteolibacter yonseiensis]MBK1814700.1 addiction module protein [Luteolibacter yonseiensis]